MCVSSLTEKSELTVFATQQLAGVTAKVWNKELLETVHVGLTYLLRRDRGMLNRWIDNQSLCCCSVWRVKGWRQPVITVLTGSSCLRFLPGRPTLRLLRGLAGVPSSGLSGSAPSSLCPIIERPHKHLANLMTVWNVSSEVALMQKWFKKSLLTNTQENSVTWIRGNTLSTLTCSL